MTDNVISLGGAVTNDAKAEFLRHVSESFDFFVARNGGEPDGLIMTWAGVRQDAYTAWLIRGESEGCTTTVKALALASLTKAIVNPEGGE